MMPMYKLISASKRRRRKRRRRRPMQVKRRKMRHQRRQDSIGTSRGTKSTSTVTCLIELRLLWTRNQRMRVRMPLMSRESCLRQNLSQSRPQLSTLKCSASKLIEIRTTCCISSSRKWMSRATKALKVTSCCKAATRVP